jgi:hypothetical protein
VECAREPLSNVGKLTLRVSAARALRPDARITVPRGAEGRAVDKRSLRRITKPMAHLAA